MDDNDELKRLMTEARKGNNQALGALLAQLRPCVRQLAQGHLDQRLRARLDCSDIVQDVHLRALEHFAHFRGGSVGELLAWLKEILQNAVTDCRRRHGAEKRDARAEVAGGDLFPALAGHATTPSQGAMRHEDEARLTAALQGLPDKQRLVFQLRFFEGLAFDEVARRVGLTVGNARVLMVRATQTLRNELGDRA